MQQHSQPHTPGRTKVILVPEQHLHFFATPPYNSSRRKKVFALFQRPLKKIWSRKIFIFEKWAAKTRFFCAKKLTEKNGPKNQKWHFGVPTFSRQSIELKLRKSGKIIGSNSSTRSVACASALSTFFEKTRFCSEGRFSILNEKMTPDFGVQKMIQKIAFFRKIFKKFLKTFCTRKNQKRASTCSVQNKKRKYFRLEYGTYFRNFAIWAEPKIFRSWQKREKSCTLGKNLKKVEFFDFSKIFDFFEKVRKNLQKFSKKVEKS